MVELLAHARESRYFVHAKILVSQSQPFHDALVGNWKEATERKVDLHDWDGDTVGRLVEFLYRGNYGYPPPAALSTNNPPLDGGGSGNSGPSVAIGRLRA